MLKPASWNSTKWVTLFSSTSTDYLHHFSICRTSPKQYNNGGTWFIYLPTKYARAIGSFLTLWNLKLSQQMHHPLADFVPKISKHVQGKHVICMLVFHMFSYFWWLPSTISTRIYCLALWETRICICLTKLAHLLIPNWHQRKRKTLLLRLYAGLIYAHT